MNESHDREIIGGHLLVIGGAEDKYNERRILKRFLVVKINLDRHRRGLLAETRTDKNQGHGREKDSTLSHLRISSAKRVRSVPSPCSRINRRCYLASS